MALALLAAAPLAAHVGDVNSFFDGVAGPYPIRVIVRPPGVVPGRAEITVRTSATDVRQITVKPVKWDAGDGGSPPPDVAKPVAGERGLYWAQLWLMSNGSYSIYVDVDGGRGSGRAIVPITNIAVKRLPMPKLLAIALLIFGVVLVIGAVSVVGAGVREAIVRPGVEPTAAGVRRAWMAMAFSALLFVAMVARGNVWWNHVDAAYRKQLFKPFAVKTTVAGGVLTLAIDDARWRDQQARWTPIMPDHGKLMHLFLIADGGSGAMAHLHPISATRDRFRVNLPPLPAGRYRLFADITHESGFAQTLVDVVTIGIPSPDSVAAQRNLPLPQAGEDGESPQAGEGGGSDPDDSWFSSSHASAASLSFQPTRLVAGRDVDLRFDVRDANGRPAAPEPYMGMEGHAVITSEDFSVFVHVHPNGTISMASQQKFLERDGKSAPHEHAMHGPGSVIAFPYAFPKPGRYHLWVQTKLGGEVITRKFDVNVS